MIDRKLFIKASLILFAIFPCSGPFVRADNDAAAPAKEAPASKVSGIDKQLFSDDVSPGENFYVYANQSVVGHDRDPR